MSSPQNEVQAVQPISNDTSSSRLPIREIPGSYGIPFIGAIKDRLDYYYNQGRDNFFKIRMQKYQSTVFRSNMPPGSFMAKDPRVIVLLDAKSFPILFDVTKVEKRDVLTGTYIPSTSLTGGYRVLAYLDPSEPSHTNIKNLIFFILSTRHGKFIPEFHKSFSTLFDNLEAELSKSGKADFNSLNDVTSFDYLSQAFFGVNPSDTMLGSNGSKIAAKWLLFQLHPLMTLGLPKLLEELLLHTFHLPPFLVKSDYNKLYDFFYKASTKFLDEAEKMGIKRDEACHNILFATIFNAYGGMKLLFPGILKWVSLAGAELHQQLTDEIRSNVKSNDGQVTLAAIEKMPLTKSVVYEALRIEPPVMFQYGKAKKDLIIESHDAAFEIKKGEMIFGFQPFATKDPKIFEDGEEFIGNRFVGEGEKLVKYVVWSNGPETESPTVGNKQCAGKDIVVMMGMLLVIEFFLRYDTFTADIGNLPFGPSVTVKSLTKAV
ncbi:allene oxide synthase 1, chloroplastic-like [Magnolia sinica]|uniref:allene oxide synthase 1, chloroplastic-like n=1 Tax=Magnolia sinica TaxID=86752 RepID=UPI00265B6DA5|nr:allene oxide synthase 1, chloroplastic-like [Magnolia sinica]